MRFEFDVNRLKQWPVTPTVCEFITCAVGYMNNGGKNNHNS